MRQEYAFEENPAVISIFCTRFAKRACRPALFYGTYCLVKKLNRNFTTKNQSKFSLPLGGNTRLWTGSWPYGHWGTLKQALCICQHKALELLWQPEVVLVLYERGKHRVHHHPPFSSFMSLELPFQLPCHLTGLGHHLDYDRVARCKLVCRWAVRATGCKIPPQSSPPLEETFRLWKLEGRLPKTSSW